MLAVLLLENVFMMMMIIIAVQIFSLCIMLAFMYEFHHVHARRMEFMRTLGSDQVRSEVWNRRFIMIIYVLITIIIMIGIIALFFYQVSNTF